VDRERSVEALGQLFQFYLDHPEAMPRSYQELAQINPRYRVVCDYIAGMTDHFLLRQHADQLGANSSRLAR
jgi:dGTPase